MRSLRLLLYPFALIYGLVTWLRNKAFDLGLLKSQSFEVDTLAIGNLNTGGTGKTPHTAYFVRQNSHKKVAVISRGYGRKSKGFRFVEVNDDPAMSGDEPLLLKRAFPGIPVAVCEDRVLAIPELLGEYQDTELIIFDDAFQHRYLKAGRYILLTSYGDLFCDDHVLPAGNLREFRSGYRRAHDIIVTKCPPQLSAEEKEKIRRRINPLPGQQLYFSFNKSSLPRTLDGTETSLENTAGKKLLVFSAIAHGDEWAKSLKNRFSEVLPSLTYPDHHTFTSRDIDLLIQRIQRGGADETLVFTTAKDAVKLEKYKTRLENYSICYLDVEVEMMP